MLPFFCPCAGDTSGIDRPTGGERRQAKSLSNSRFFSTPAGIATQLSAPSLAMMARNELCRAVGWLSRRPGALLSRPEAVTGRCLTTPWSRLMATESPPSSTEFLSREAPTSLAALREALRASWEPAPVLTTTYSFPSMEPVAFVEYPREHLGMHLRKDILHRAVVYEGDKTRQGTASTKWRDDVHGSGRKLHRQKGTGRARVGDKKSPIRVGGGVAHGPHPRDFSSGLPRKVYDKAWRIALSYRHRRGQLIVIDNDISIPEDASPHLIQKIFDWNQWGRQFGRSTLITDQQDDHLLTTVTEAEQSAVVLSTADVDVKSLLETARLIIEKKALDRILATHSKDLNRRPAMAVYSSHAPESDTV